MRKKSAFTFIEVMIAIVIFSIGILAVLRLVTDNLETMDRNNIKIQATVLAKEGIELAYNLRDSNLEKELSWNCLMDDQMYLRNTDDLWEEISRGWDISSFEDIICDWYFGIKQNLQISFDPEIYVYHKNSDITSDFYANYENNKLYLYEGEISGYPMVWYWYDDELEVESSSNYQVKDTFFARYLSFDEVKEWDDVLPSDKILKIESHVLYMKWGNTGEVVFESFIWNY